MQKISVSRQFARWAHGLRYEELPPAVIDKIKALSLHALCSAVLGADHPHTKHLIDVTLAEEGKPDGARILGRTDRATRVGAAFANAEVMHASGLFDSYRMLTHPGPVVVPAALVNADLEKRNGRDFIVALTAGYELSCRLCDWFIPSTAARGFRPSPIYSTLAASLVSGRLLGLSEDKLVTAIALGANFASGLNEGPRSGTNEIAIHEPQAARNGVFAGVFARDGAVKGAETSIEGEAGFYNAFTGSSKGELTYVFGGPLKVDPTAVVDGLGQEYKLLTAMFRMYACAGYNQPVIDLMAEMKAAHKLRADDIAEVAVAMNWLETLYPSPAFPRFSDFQEPRIGETTYYAAHATVNGGYPVVGGRTFGPTGSELTKDERVIAFMKERMKLVPQKDRAMFSPQITVTMKDGTKHVQDYPYARMEWNFDQLVARLQDCFPEPGLLRDKFEGMVTLTRDLDRLDSLDPIFALASKRS
jgi:2-methylcitrate dehydratase PrpD